MVDGTGDRLLQLDLFLHAHAARWARQNADWSLWARAGMKACPGHSAAL